jgi:hypothetical protein
MVVCHAKIKIAALNKKSNANWPPETLYVFARLWYVLHSLIEFQYWTVNEFVKQVLEGNVISSIEDENNDNFDKKVSEWIADSYENDFNFHESERLQKITKEIFDQIVYLRLTGKLTGILSLHKFGKS